MRFFISVDEILCLAALYLSILFWLAKQSSSQMKWESISSSFPPNNGFEHFFSDFHKKLFVWITCGKNSYYI